MLIVEDDSRAREFFRASVLACVRLELVGCVGSVAEALAVLQDPQAVPDILLVDLNLPDGLGLDVIRYASRHCPSAESLVISMFGDEDNVLAAIEAGALGYIHKDDTPENIAKTIVDMHAGASPISPMIARRVLSHFRTQRGQPTGLAPVPGPGPGPGPAPAPAPVPEAEAEPVAVERRAVPRAPKDSQVGGTAERPVLSSREQEVLELIARGFSYAEIARIKNISVHTVQTHIKGLYGKLSVHSKNEAVYEATRIGLL